MKKNNAEVQYIRDGYGFRNYFDADCDDLCHRDDSGVEVFEEDSSGDWHLIGTVSGTDIDDIKDMTDAEFNQMLAENYIM